VWKTISGSSTSITLPAGNGAFSVLISVNEDKGLILKTSGRIGSGTVVVPPYVDAELLWSPDEAAVAVTASEGGAIGLFDTYVIRSAGGRMIVDNLSPLIRRAFGHPVRCDSPEKPNVAAIKFLPDSRYIILAAQIMGHSNCDSFGTFKAYLVDIDRSSIRRSYNQLTAKQMFAEDIGVELRDAPDECIKTPKACWVSTNHSGRTGIP
jgi:hypothetical protein